MSYAKAMRHARNVRKSRKQGNMYFGFDTGTVWPNPRRDPETAALIHIQEWWPQRHDGDSQHVREAIREQIAQVRSLRTAVTAGDRDA